MIGGLVYGFVVFMILPVYASLERMDVSLIEAGKDLYHGPLRTFFTVTLPATRAGLYGGMLLVFLPALGDFVSAQLLGGAEHLHDRQPDPAAVRRGPELAARLGDDGGDDGRADRADGRLPARDVDPQPGSSR